MEPSRVEIVLVRPSRPANVAAACRAMKNMGLTRLCLVEPPVGLSDPEARALAYGAWDVLDGARVAPSLADAVAASTFVVGTTGRDLPGAWTPRRLAREASGRSAGGALSVVFGPEASGLTSAELALCHVEVHAPTHPDHASINLAQAVLLVAYELRLATGAGEAGGSEDAAPDQATAGELEAAVQDLRAALLDAGYLDPANPDLILAELRRLLARAAPTRREVTLLRGLARQVGWAGRVARGRSATP
jgi:TrmH family RNA methyltransferase